MALLTEAKTDKHFKVFLFPGSSLNEVFDFKATIVKAIARADIGPV